MEITSYDVVSNMLWATINTYTYVILVFIFNRSKRKSLKPSSAVVYILLCFVVDLAQRFVFGRFPSRIFLISVFDPVFLVLRTLLILAFFDTRLKNAVALVLFYFGGYFLSSLIMVNLLSIRTTLTFAEGFPFYARFMHEMSMMAVVTLFFYVNILLLGIVRRAKSPPKVSVAHAVGILLPSCLYIVGYFLIFPYMMEIKNKDFPFIIGSIMFLLNVAVFFLVVDADRKNVHLYYLDKQYQKQEQYFLEIKESNLAIQKYAHDERKHYVYIAGLLRQGEYDRLGKYLSSLNEKSLEVSDLIITGNFDVDTILNAKMLEAEEAGCYITVDGQLPGNLAVDPVDFCILIGNCLDNAIAACLKTDKREIKVDFMHYKHMLFIRVENAYLPSAKMIPVKSETMARLGPGRGMGLTIMASVARKYNGDFKTTRQDGIFTAEIFLHTKAKASSKKRRR